RPQACGRARRRAPPARHTTRGSSSSAWILPLSPPLRSSTGTMREDVHHAGWTSSHPTAVATSARRALCRALTEPRAHEGDERCHVERLAQVAGGAGAGVEPCRGDLVVCGDEDDRWHFTAGHESILQVESGKRPEAHVQHETGGHTTRDALEELLARGE